MATDGRKIREIRRKFGLKQGDVARELGVTQGTISRWEKGKQEPGFDALFKLAKMVGLADPYSFVLDADEHPYGSLDDWRDGIKIVGGANYQKWVESPYWEDKFQFSVNVPISDNWKKADIVGFHVDDDHANYHFKAGSIVFIARYDENRIKPLPGDLTIFAEKGADGLYSVAIREYLDFAAVSAPVTDRVVLMQPSTHQDGWDLELSAKRIDAAAASGGLARMGFIGVIVSAYSIMAPDRLPPIDDAPASPSDAVKRIKRHPPKPPRLPDGSGQDGDAST